MFNENSTKSDEHQSMEFPSSISSVCACDKYIAIGFANGMLKILLNDQQKSVKCTILSRKFYVEMVFEFSQFHWIITN